MSYLQLLYYCEIQISKLSHVQKVQLYLLPILVSLLIVYHTTPLDAKSVLKSQVITQTSNIKSHEFFKQLQEKLQLHTLQLNKIQENEQGFFIEVQGAFHSLLHFLKFCESYKSVNILNKINFEPKANQASNAVLNIEFQFEKLLYQSSAKTSELNAQIETLKNPFFKKKTPLQEPLKLFAIVNDEVLINQEWVEQNGKIEEYEVMRIEKDYVDLKNKDGQTLHLEL